MVYVRLFLRDDAVCLEVVDQGMGVAAQEMEHLFKPFYRSEQHNHLPGSGIGLSLVKTIAEKCGGNIRLESERGKGSKAIFYLPRYEHKAG